MASEIAKELMELFDTPLAVVSGLIRLCMGDVYLFAFLFLSPIHIIYTGLGYG